MLRSPKRESEDGEDKEEGDIQGDVDDELDKYMTVFAKMKVGT